MSQFLYYLKIRSFDVSNMKISICIILVFTFLTSCSQAIVEYKELEVKNTDSLESKSLNDTFTFGYANKILVYDSLLIVYDEMQENKVLFFHKETGEYLESLGRLGQGPGELLTPNSISVNLKTGILSIYDYARSKVIAYNLPEFINKDSKHWSYIDLPEYEIRPKEVISVGANDFIALHGKPRFTKSREGRILTSYDEFPLLPETEDDEQAKRMYFLTQSLFSASPDGRKIVTATTLGGIMQIFDSKDSSISMKAENFIYQPVFSVRKGQIETFPETVYGFACLQATDKYIYATLHGVANPTVYPNVIYVFDWNGTPVKKLYSDQQICFFHVDEPEGKVYAVVLGKDNEQKLMYFE